MIKDFISLCGVDVPCYFISPVDRFNSEWLVLLRACDPTRICGLCGHFYMVLVEKVKADCPGDAEPVRAFYNCLDEVMNKTLNETTLSRTVYFPSYVRAYLRNAGVPYVKVHDLHNSEIRQLWLDKQMRIIQGDGQ